MALLILFYPFLEGYAWYLFIERYSFLDALFLVMTGVVLGLVIMMMQGRAALGILQTTLSSGQTPASKVVHRGVVMFGGLLIFLPGLLSKILGVFFILPGFRHFMVWFFRWYLAGKVAKGSFQFFMANGSNSFYKSYKSAPTDDRDVVEVQPTSIEHKQKEESSRPKS